MEEPKLSVFRCHNLGYQEMCRPSPAQGGVMALRAEAWVTQTFRSWSEEEEPTTEMEKGEINKASHESQEQKVL